MNINNGNGVTTESISTREAARQLAELVAETARQLNAALAVMRKLTELGEVSAQRIVALEHRVDALERRTWPTV